MAKSKEEIQKEKDEFLRQFVPPTGNVWGWKFSLFGLGLILFFSIWIAWLHYKKGVPFGFKEQNMEVNPMVLPEKTDTINYE
jgi:hypothetical protein